MATIGIGFERHGRTPGTEGNTSSIILPQPLRRRSMQQRHLHAETNELSARLEDAHNSPASACGQIA